MLDGDGYVSGSTDLSKQLRTRVAWWLRIAFSKHAWSGPWRAALLLSVKWRLLPRSLRGRTMGVFPPGSSRELHVRLLISDLRILEDVFLEEQYRWPLAHDPKELLDVGAYVGLSTVYFATRYPSARIIAVEPNLENYELLVRNTQGLENVHAVHAALWNRKCTLDMVDPGQGPFALRVVNHNGSGAVGTERVDALTVADLADDYGIGRIDLLKVDIEGSEVEVFSDASGWIDRVDAVCLELHDRLRPGCSRVFFHAVSDFPVELWRGEAVLVTRRADQLVPTS